MSDRAETYNPWDEPTRDLGPVPQPMKREDTRPRCSDCGAPLEYDDDCRRGCSNRDCAIFWRQQ